MAVEFDPNSARSRFATAPTATRAAVSRALARSRTLRTSSKPYFTALACRHDRTEAGDPFDIDLGIDRFDGHFHRPVDPVLVLNPEGDGRAEGLAVADAGLMSAWSDSIFIRPPRP